MTFVENVIKNSLFKNAHRSYNFQGIRAKLDKIIALLMTYLQTLDSFKRGGSACFRVMGEN